MKRRWFIYILVGIVFGVIDYYYQILITNTLLHWQTGSGLEQIAWLILNFGIWLVPLVPIILREAKTSRSIWRCALAGSLTWCASIIAYYLYLVIELLIIGNPFWPNLHISNQNTPYFWETWQSYFVGFIVPDNLIWLAVALVGGSMLGLLLGALYLRLKPAVKSPAV